MPTLLITGANRGIGLELTQRYLSEGWNIHACCRHPDQATELQQLAEQHQGKLHIHRLEVTQAEQREALAQQLAGTPIDILFNNAGVSGGWGNQSFGSTNVSAWEKILASNVIAPVKMMEAFVEHVAASDLKIMANMSSKMGSIDDNGSGGIYLYRSSKAALNMVCVSAAKDLAPREIKVAILHPGWVRTDMGGENGELSVTESAQQLRRNLSQMTMADSGRFMDIDGSTIPW